MSDIARLFFIYLALILAEKVEVFHVYAYTILKSKYYVQYCIKLQFIAIILFKDD